MSTEERLARLETRADGQDAWLQSINTTVMELRDLASAGKGAIAIFLKIGAVAAAFVCACAWLYDKVPFHK